MRKVRMLVLSIIVAGSLTGCSMMLSDSQKAEYYKMKTVSEGIHSEVDTTRYNEAVLFIMSPKLIFKDYYDSNIDNFKSLIDDSAVSKVRSLIRMDSEESVKGAGSEDMEGEPNPYENIELFGEDESYPLYGEYYSIKGYGTLEEAKKAIEDFKIIPDNSIVSTDVYRDYITVRVDNKYDGISMIRLTIKDNMIHDFEIFK